MQKNLKSFNRITIITFLLWQILQAHPDTRSYKTKAVQNFSDLCLIYGYTTADGRYSRSSHDMDVDDEVHALNLGLFLSSLKPI